MYYPSSENKGADQLRGYREADLRLCFRLGRLLVFQCGGSFDDNSLGLSVHTGYQETTNATKNSHGENAGLGSIGCTYLSRNNIPIREQLVKDHFDPCLVVP